MIVFCKAVFHTATSVHVCDFCAILLHTKVGGWFGYSHYISLFCVYSGLADVPKQAVANAVSAK